MIYVLTYDRPHRKTQDLLYRLALAGADCQILLLEWQERKNHRPLFQVKPEPFSCGPQRLCERLGWTYVHGNQAIMDSLSDEVIVIAGAGILPERFVKDNTVINAHCGWLPQIRGLDALKWAIYYDEIIGVTTHVVDGRVDVGRLIDRREVSLYPIDSLCNIAMRQYEMELDMLVETVMSQSYRLAREYGEPALEPNHA